MKREIKVENGKLFYYNFDLEKLAKEYGTPLKITFLDLIKDRILDLKHAFDEEIIKTNYEGKFIYLNANKANYGVLEIETAYKYADGLECSSYHDLLLTKDIMDKYDDAFEKYIVCNGYKKEDYIDEIIKLSESGYNIINIIDNTEEYEIIKKKTLSKNLHLGLRVHLESLYTEENEIIQNDRFGVNNCEFEYIINDINKYSNLVLNTIHFHQRGFEFEKDKFIANIDKAFEYYVKASKVVKDVRILDIGGGTPLPEYSSFDYNMWANLLLTRLKEKAAINNVPMPTIISENGKYSQKDSTVNVYEVVGVKNTDNIPWYIIDGSLLIALPEMYALGEEIAVMPVNGINNEMIKTRLAGITCDCDDIYYNKKLGYIYMPKKTENNKVYIALLGTGSYQNSMNGKGGTHHCLLPEEIDLVIHNEDYTPQYNVRGKLQTIDDMKKILKF